MTASGPVPGDGTTIRMARGAAGNGVTADSPAPAASLFRAHAVSAYRQGQANGEPVAAPRPKGRVFFWCLASWTLAVAIGAFFVLIDLTTTGRGALRAPGTAHPVSSQVTGVVTDIRVSPGAQVRAGDVLARVDAVELRSSILEVERHLATLEAKRERLLNRTRSLYARRESLLRERLAILGRRKDSEAGSSSHFESRLGVLDDLADRGYAAKSERDVLGEQFAESRRRELQTQGDSFDVEFNLARLQGERDTGLWQFDEEIAEARAKKDALDVLMSQATLRAPRDGYVEMVRAKIGDALRTGDVVAGFWDTPDVRSVCAALPERDRAFLTIGAEARIELDQLPLSEFGTLRARVEQISSAPAASADLEDCLGVDAGAPAAPSYVVRLRLVEDARFARLAPQLRPGMFLSAHYVLRRRTLGQLLFSPTRNGQGL